MRFMKNCQELLKKDGTLILVEKRSFSQGLKRLFTCCWEKPLARVVHLLSGVKLIPVDTIEMLLDSAGFYIFEQRYFYFGALQVMCAQKKRLLHS